GLYNQSRAPHKHPNQIPFEIEQLIVRFKKEKPKWGAPKIRELVANKYRKSGRGEPLEGCTK
ncbi:MAG: hypothetical protein ABH859_08720, partial [Pseudomonadota bacterium]